jgi:hypothetical protein
MQAKLVSFEETLKSTLKGKQREEELVELFP